MIRDPNDTWWQKLRRPGELALWLALGAWLLELIPPVLIAQVVVGEFLAAGALSLGFIDLRYSIEAAPKPRIALKAELAVVAGGLLLACYSAISPWVMFLALVALAVTTALLLTPLAAAFTGARYLLSPTVRREHPGGITAACFAVFLPLVLGVFLFVAIYPGLVGHEDRRQGVLRIMRVAGIVRTIQQWTVEHGNGRYPRSLRQACTDDMIPAPNVLRPGRESDETGAEFVSDYECLFDRAPFRIAAKDVPPSLPLAWEKEAFFRDGRYVGLADGRIEFLSEDEFARLMQHVNRWIEQFPTNRPDTLGPAGPEPPPNGPQD